MVNDLATLEYIDEVCREYTGETFMWDLAISVDSPIIAI